MTEGLMALLGGAVAAGAHLTKAGTRAVVNTSPEPVSNWALSLAEDVFVVGLGILTLSYPVAAFGVAGVLVLLMLLFLGVSLARLTVQGVVRAVILSVVRIGGGLAVGVLLVWAFGLTGPAAGVVLIQSSMPVAVFNYLFAQYYDNSPAEVAGLVVVSTAISFATLPFLLAFVL